MINETQARKYCKDPLDEIEGYAAAIADARTWDLHHRLEIQDDRVVTVKELIAQGLYWHRPAAELVFLTKTEHRMLHMRGERAPWFGKHLSEEHRRKIGEAERGEKNHWFGKHHSEESRRKMSESRRGKNCGEKNPMFGKLGTRWWNDGVKAVQARERPGEGWVRGRLRR